MDKLTLEILLGFSELSIDLVEVKKSSINLHCHSKLEEGICPLCLEKCKKIKSTTTRQIRDMSLLGKEVYLHLESRQFVCENCERYFQESFSFVDSSKNQTLRLEKYLYMCLKDSSFKQVSVRENVLWDVLQDLFNRYAKKEIKDNLAYFPKRIGIDEFSYRKGKKDYAVVLVDLDRGCVWEVLAERTKEYLKAYFLSKGDAFCQGVEVVSCDMWEGFSNTAKEVFPNAEVVIDRFHFFVHCHEVLDKIRKELRKQDPNNVCFKAIKWLLYKPWKDLNEQQRSVLLKAFRRSPALRQVYFLKVELQNIFNASISKIEAEKLIEDWLKQAEALKNKAMDTFIKTFKSWKNDILNFFNHGHSNGIVEGINNAIGRRSVKTLKRVAYGFRNFQHFRDRILVNFI